MRKGLLTAAVALGLLAPASLSPAVEGARAAPREFFGIVPQTALGDTDAERMRAGRIGSVRWPLAWSGVQREPEGAYEWGGFDAVVATAARHRLRVLPFAYATPDWIARDYTRLPVDNARQRRAWSAFLRAAVERYGPHGEFWREHGRDSGDYVPKLAIRDWQIWNEANFFYFAKPASPTRYARLLRISKRAQRRADPSARIVLSGLFGEPTAKRPNAMPAVPFLARLYRAPGIKATFDAVALHPYSETAADLRRMTELLRQTMDRNGDRGARLLLTEIGWGSQHDPDLVSFERGVHFQIREMRRAYRYMLRNRLRLRLDGAYWFTWKDIQGSCNFCDSTGLFRDADRLRPKRAWHAFVRITGGRPRP